MTPADDPATSEPAGARTDFPEPLVRFAELFDQRRFWDAHEVLEGPWRAKGSDFYHGLILYASAFVHAQRDNAHGIAAQLRKTERTLEPFAPAYLGLDLQVLLREARGIRKRVEAERSRETDGSGGPDGPVGEGETRPWHERIGFPGLRLDRALIRGDEPELNLRSSSGRRPADPTQQERSPREPTPRS